MRNFTSEFKNALVSSFFEYLLTLLPIALYVCIEAIHKHSPMYFIKSPEWSIGTIFLSSLGISEYIQKGFSTPKKKLPSMLKIYSLLNVIVIFFASLNIAWSIEKETTSLILLRCSLLLIASCIFFIFMINAKLNTND